MMRTNLCVNPNIETNTTGWTAGALSSISRSTADFRSGAASLLISNNFSFTAGILFGDTGGGGPNAQAINVTPGQVITVSVYLKSTTGSGTLYLDTAFCTNGVTYTTGGSTSTPTATNGTWQRHSVTQTVPAGSTKMRFHLQQNSVSNPFSYYVDDALAELASSAGTYFDGSTVTSGVLNAWTGTANASTSTQVTTPLRINLIPNPSFEVGVTNWSNTTRTNSTAGFPGANYSGTYVGSWNTAGGAAKSANIAVTAGLDYAASAWCTKVTAATRSCAISLHFFDSGGTELDAPTTTLTALTTNGVPERRSHIRTAPAGAVNAQVWYERDSASQAFDSVLLEQSSTVGDYFDGSWAPAGYSTRWQGTDHNSTSYLWTADAAAVRIKVQESGAMNPKSALPKVRVAGAWVTKRPKRWNGSAWVDLN